MNDMTAGAAQLTLSLRNPDVAGGKARSEMVFGEDGGNIGRGNASDWVLDATGVSRLHASIRCIDGTYFIEDHSTNGVLHNGTPVRSGSPVALRDGDQLRIDVFHVEVKLPSVQRTGEAVTPSERTAQTSPTAQPATAADDGLADAFDLVRGSGQDGDDAFDALVAPTGEARAKVDPLALFSTDFSFAESDSRGSATSQMPWNHGAAGESVYHPPKLTPSSATNSTLPENWDSTRSEFDRLANSAQPIGASEPASGESAAPVESTSGGQGSDVTGRGETAEAEVHPGKESRRSSSPDPVAAMPEPAVLAEDVKKPAADDGAHGASAQRTTSSPAAREAVSPVAAPERPVTPPASSALADPAPAPLQGERHHALLLALAAGVMDVLHARAELKNSLRLPVTLIQRTENNPLKFAPTAEEAVKRLLGEPDPAYLTGMSAVDDARRDIGQHHMAMLAGMRAAFESVFAQFAPSHFEAEGDEGGMLGWRKGNPAWKRYKEFYASLLGDADDRFRRLFGEEFALAYEEQMTRARSARRPDGGA